MILPETLKRVTRLKVREVLKADITDIEKEDEIIQFMFDAMSSGDYRLKHNRYGTPK